MNELMIIVFGLAVVRTLTPLIKKENFKLPTIFVAFITCWAFYHLLLIVLRLLLMAYNKQTNRVITNK